MLRSMFIAPRTEEARNVSSWGSGGHCAALSGFTYSPQQMGRNLLFASAEMTNVLLDVARRNRALWGSMISQDVDVVWG